MLERKLSFKNFFGGSWTLNQTRGMNYFEKEIHILVEIRTMCYKIAILASFSVVVIRDDYQQLWVHFELFLSLSQTFGVK